MSTMQFSNSKASIPNFQSVADSVKTIKRSVPAISDGAYPYLTDRLTLAAVVADDLETKITETLALLPVSLDATKVVQELLQDIGKIDEAQRTGQISTEQANTERAQLQGELNDAVSSLLTDFNNAATKLSEFANRLSKFGEETEVRLKDAIATETANNERLKQDVDRESARLKTLKERYDKLCAAVDKARGTPTKDIVGLLPDEKELSSLLDAGLGDAAAPEVAVAKKSIELAIGQIKSILAVVDKTIKFNQLAQMRNEVNKALTTQRTVVDAFQQRLQAQNATLSLRETIGTAVASMTALATETTKLSTAFFSFATTLRDLNNQAVTEDTLMTIINDMEFYVNQARNERHKVILS
ncbi:MULTISPECIES: alpha-xenorhabdolysin family binary toxin subunit B [unclassified Microcystis]|uniref:alpha-xenorhabdolysin family binary toxin subunit B n=1 Tax=unclassified Microcystis TaxID=2643300 RepID=UPI0022C97536|nr:MULTISPECIES: alpha-xenorhabdolysin family binary toxin subunit B [unclassified Microcystis]MCA2694137.1 alpha-xenorhabdolysin family binary toxin subunit B [Microcystis sp. M034S2]MCA2752425.1 alpha-xenorhabdolysin family binary toxin subunit B [Microcystis sp. M144S2]MCZ8200623.1 alpha-xenorhabdolysin family binary toxin subunit B [Microcystis sp. LE19-55.1A]MCZ8306418.1 alpha-xenorhabdolysin family binary toxin subunit B [Microcystis sp. LE19-98.1E]